MAKSPNGFPGGKNYSDPSAYETTSFQNRIASPRVAPFASPDAGVLAAECRQRGFAITRTKLAKYEIGMAQVPARFIPIITHILKVDITDLLPPINGEDQPKSRPELTQIRNLSGKRIRFFRKKQKWTQHKLAAVLKKISVAITRDIIANVEIQRTPVRDYQLIFFARALQIPLDSLLPVEAAFAELAVCTGDKKS